MKRRALLYIYRSRKKSILCVNKNTYSEVKEERRERGSEAEAESVKLRVDTFALELLLPVQAARGEDREKLVGTEEVESSRTVERVIPVPQYEEELEAVGSLLRVEAPPTLADLCIAPTK